MKSKRKYNEMKYKSEMYFNRIIRNIWLCYFHRSEAMIFNTGTSLSYSIIWYFIVLILLHSYVFFLLPPSPQFVLYGNLHALVKTS